VWHQHPHNEPRIHGINLRAFVASACASNSDSLRDRAFRPSIRCVSIPIPVDTD
jgi:hypothetical protein